LVKFGTYVLPRVLDRSVGYPQQQQQIPLPGRSVAYRRRIGGLGARITLGGSITPASQQTRDQIAALADGTARILDLQDPDLTVLEACLRFQTGPTWTDNTVESQSAGGTPFTLLGATTDYAYFGHREKCNQLKFDLQTLGSYGARTWEYSKGSGSWGTLTIDADGTAGFTQDGAVLFTPPSDWKQDTVNSIANKFWVRVKVASVTTVATVNQIQLNLVYLCLLLDPEFPENVRNYNAIPYRCTLLQQENP
jgi:hypothetical protein